MKLGCFSSTSKKETIKQKEGEQIKHITKLNQRVPDCIFELSCSSLTGTVPSVTCECSGEQVRWLSVALGALHRNFTSCFLHKLFLNLFLQRFLVGYFPSSVSCHCVQNTCDRNVDRCYGPHLPLENNKHQPPNFRKEVRCSPPN